MWILSVFVVYLAVLAAIGVYCMRFNRTLEDFVLGGRRMGVCESSTFRSQPVDVGCLHLGRTVAADVAEAQIVSENDDHIRSLGGLSRETGLKEKDECGPESVHRAFNRSVDESCGNIITLREAGGHCPPSSRPLVASGVPSESSLAP